MFYLNNGIWINNILYILEMSYVFPPKSIDRYLI